MNVRTGQDLHRATRNAETGAPAVETLAYATSECPLGRVLVATSPRGVCAISLGDSDADLVRELQERFPNVRCVEDQIALSDHLVDLVHFMERPSRGLRFTLDMRGTPFQRLVWETLRAIPSGSTVSYSELARRIGTLISPRAVAGACAANPFALAVPCHRVVSSKGDLVGFRWGVDRKQALIEREAAA